MKEWNAKITSASLGFERGTIFTCSIMFEWDGAGQGFGGICLDTYEGETGKGERVGTAYGCQFIMDLLNAVGVEEWSDLKGTYVRLRSADRYGAPIKAVGHIIKNQWFSPEELRDKMVECEGCTNY